MEYNTESSTTPISLRKKVDSARKSKDNSQPLKVICNLNNVVQKLKTQRNITREMCLSVLGCASHFCSDSKNERFGILKQLVPEENVSTKLAAEARGGLELESDPMKSSTDFISMER
ncbi:hypothetical protein RUM44_004960 [Polyplax serrata]|uniref:Uncharacterized protein n=1 Tax=Polyplax serrata TaxID=468196 RepID=A0ABR1AWI1_POLSC